MEQTDSSKSGRDHKHSEQIDPALEQPPLLSSEKTKSFKSNYYPEVTQNQWNSWKWQIRNSITSYKDLQRIFGSSDYELSEDINLPLRITPYYASLITNLNDSIGKCVIPTSNELIVMPNEENDSLHEEHQSPVTCIVHRYPDRVLFLTTDFCSSYCRYCTRSHMVGHTKITRKNWDEGIQYIKDHSEIRDVLLSGGDFLLLSDENIEYLLKEIRTIKHVEFLRIGTKTVVSVPQRITIKLAKILRKYRVFVNIHFTHPNEITPEVERACDILVDHGIPLFSQTVLLKSVNDNIEIMKSLMHKLLMIRIKPYYLYIADRVVGTHHFRTSITKGIEIIRGLRGYTSGMAIPTLILDSQYGKIDISDNIISKENNTYELRTYKNKIIKYKEEKFETI
ncbi:MAG: KamA family radical SAM protein [Clostridia bacterium]